MEELRKELGVSYEVVIAGRTGEMGELLLCNGMLAAMPYYIENVSLNIYSLEELCYYLEQNTYLLEPDFMNEELCAWIEEEAGNLALARRLRTIKNTGGSLQQFVTVILEETGNCPSERLKEIQQELLETADKTGYECQKMRADKLVQNQKYKSAIAEYQLLLQEKNVPADFLGNVWHNLGTVYTKLFFWQEACNCYQRAYELNQNRESLKEWLMTYRCMRDEVGFLAVAQENLLEEEYLDSLREEVTQASRDEKVQEFEKELRELFYLKKSGQESAFETNFLNLITEWKKEYRRICR